jgi:Flp pilus assembly pilin Flp
LTKLFQLVSRVFQKEDRGQDLAEYCLLTALIALVAVGIFVYCSGGLQALWGSANTTLAAGNAVTNSQPAGATASAPAGQ